MREVISEEPDRSYIAFVDDRQLAERAAAGIEAARSITEAAIIVESRDAMAYRSGLMRRERIEEVLRAGEIRGIASTSAMELGIDIPDLQVGLNLGLLHSVGRLRQRAGRVGRNSQGRFIIVAPRHDIRDAAADGRARIVQTLPEGETELLTSEVTRREAARDAHPLATYFHAKQSYSILGWRETGGETVITARHPHAAAAPRFWTGPPGILHPCAGGDLGTDRRLRHTRTGRW